MNPNEGAAARHQDRRAPIRLMKEPPTERRWRRTLAALAISALAIGGMSTLAAAPAFADDTVPVAEAEATTADVGSDATAPAPASEVEVAPAEDAAPEPAPAPAPASAPAPAPAPAPEPEPEFADPAAGAPVTDVTEAEPTTAEAHSPAAASAEASDAAAFLVPPPSGEPVQKVEICHATASHNNPYVVNEPAADGNVSGHAGHIGPIWFPGITVEWGDIIPPFFYEDPDGVHFFEGRNWDATGQLVFANDCVVPEEPDIDIVVTDCIAYSGFGLLEVSLGGLLASFDYRVTVSDAGGVVDSVVIPGTEGAWSESWDLPPGEYTVTVEWSTNEGPWFLLESLSFTINSCPDLGVMVTPGPCVIGDEGTATVTFTELIVGESYSWAVEGAAYLASDTFEATAETEVVMLDGLPPGNFTAYIEWNGEVPVFDWVGFAIEPCQPQITVEVTECPAHGGTGSALLTLSSLVSGVEYEVKVTDRGDAGGAPYGGVHVVMGDATGTAQLLVSSLPADHEYTAWVNGVFEATWEEPPWIGNGGGFTPIGTVELTASVDFTLEPCPAPPVTPTKVVPAKTLPKTGVDAAGELFLGSLLLLGLGGVSLLAAHRRRSGDQHLS